MKKILFTVIVIFIFGCDSEKGLDCFQSSGNIIQEEFTLDTFTEIIVWERVQLFIIQGAEQKVVVETGENLLNDIDLQVKEGSLSIFNNNGCNLVRDYGLTKVYVTSPNITQIRNSSGLAVESVGIIGFPSLTLLSEDQENEDNYHVDGDFKLQLDVEELSIVANGLSKFFLSGTAERVDIGLFAGDIRVEAADLIIQDLTLYHRSTNHMIVNPQQSIRGQIVSLGDVISKNRPPIVEVEELYRGRLIFE